MAATLLTASWAAGQGGGSAGKTDPNKQLALAVVDGSVRGAAMVARASAQAEAARTLWKRLYGKDDPPHHETAHLLLFGTVPGKTLVEVGETLEKMYALARKALDLEQSPEPWPGKLTVYLFPERPQLVTFIRSVEQRRPEQEDLGSFVIRSDNPYAAAAAGKSKLDPTVEQQAGQQMAAALLTAKAGAPLPDWLLEGFGRATFVKTLASRELIGERKKTLALFAARKLTAADGYNSNLTAAEAPVLRGSLVEYLAYSGRSARFVPFLQGFRPQENRESPTTLDALKAANISPEKLDLAWRNWVRLGK